LGKVLFLGSSFARTVHAASSAFVGAQGDGGSEASPRGWRNRSAPLLTSRWPLSQLCVVAAAQPAQGKGGGGGSRRPATAAAAARDLTASPTVPQEP
jgi:hypothetical protein